LQISKKGKEKEEEEEEEEEEIRTAEQLGTPATFQWRPYEVSGVKRFCVDVLIPRLLCLST